MKKIQLLITSVILCSFLVHAQQTMYVMKNGSVIGQHNISTEVDSLIFYAPTSVPVSVSSISFSNNQTTMVSGATLNLLPLLTIAPANATNKTITWTSNNSTIVSVNASTGVATAGTTAGSAVITARTADGSNLTATITITVTLAAPKAYLSGIIPNAKYIGRWDKIMGPNATWQQVEYNRAMWPGANMKVKFTGTTAKIEINSAESYRSGFAYSIDGAPLKYVKGPDITSFVYNLTPTPLASGTHTLMIANGNGQDVSTGDEMLQIRNLILDPGATTLAPTTTKHVEFIGDSITMGWGNPNEVFEQMGWLIGEELGIEHTNIARSGITTSGMNTAYFQTSYTGNTSAWNFTTNYHPDLIFINLGQNDGCVSQSVYGGFVTKLRQVHPDAKIICMIPFNSNVNACSKAAINAVAASNPGVVFVEDGLGTKLGLINGVDYHDNVELHPNVSGNRKAANYFKPIIASYLGL